MDLSVATHFGQGQSYGQMRFDDLLGLLTESGTTGIRDGVDWALIETEPGVYDFSDFRTRYMSLVEENGFEVTLTLMPQGNPLYDDGNTVTSAEGIAAFARFVEALLTEFPMIERVVIGNEFNGLDSAFVLGLSNVRSIAERAALYTDILQGVSEAVSDSHPQVELAGGALHSVATGYVQALIDAGAFEYMDSLDIHPYGLDPTELDAALDHLNALLDTLPGDQRPTIVVTEFGRSADAEDPLSNAGFLAKSVAVMAAAGITEASWYALLDEDWTSYPDMGLYDSLTTVNDMLDGFGFVEALLATATDTTRLELGTGIEAYDFGNGTWLVWGSVQDVTITGTGLVVRDASGAVIDTPASLGDSPIYLQGSDLSLAADAGPGALLADSFYDWELASDPDGPWSYHMLKVVGGAETTVALQVLEGQTIMSESWNPYLGNNWSRPFFVTADDLMPAAFAADGSDDRASLERYTSEQDGAVDIVASWTVSDDSLDGVIVELRLNGETLTTLTVTDDSALVVRGLELETGDQLDFIVHDGDNARGDTTTRHIRLLEADTGTSTEALLAEHLQADIIDGNEATTANVLDLSAPASVSAASSWFADSSATAYSEAPDLGGSPNWFTQKTARNELAQSSLIDGEEADAFVFTPGGNTDTATGRSEDECHRFNFSARHITHVDLSLTETAAGLDLALDGTTIAQPSGLDSAGFAALGDQGLLVF